MKSPIIKRLALVAALALAALGTLGQAYAQQRAICYNCPPEWADWGSQLKAINNRLGIQVPPDNKNSGQSIAALIAEKANPVADVVYLGGIAADQAFPPSQATTLNAAISWQETAEHVPSGGVRRSFPCFRLRRYARGP